MGKTNITGYKRYMTRKEVDLILNYVEDQDMWNLFFHIMAYMGLRVSEVCRIKYSDIINDCDKLRVELSKSRSSYCKRRIKERVIPKKLRPIFRNYVVTHLPEGHEYIFFPNNNRSKNRHLQTSTAIWKIKKIRDSLGLHDRYYKNFNRIATHTFRHFFITQIYRESGNDIVLTKEIIGHKKLSTTEEYISAEVEREREIVNRL